MFKRLVVSLFLLGLVGVAAVVAWWNMNASDSNDSIRRWLVDASSRPDLTTTNDAPCPGAPFLLPSSGFVGLVWGDTARPYNPWQRHTGIDVFGDGEPGSLPVVAAYDGYLTRLDGWFSTVIIRHDDPLQPGRTIWTYYTHMGSRDGRESFVHPDFPPGTSEVFVEQGRVLGWQGEYSGSGPGIAMHVHMSIVTSDETGQFKNEAIMANTLDPSPYFGLPLHLRDNPPRPIRCEGV